MHHGQSRGETKNTLHSYLYVTRTPVAAVTAGVLSFVYFNKRNDDDIKYVKTSKFSGEILKK